MPLHIGFTVLALAALALCGVAMPALAQEASYCGGAIVAMRFSTTTVPGPRGRTNYSVQLHNTRGQNQNFRLVVTGSFLGRPAPTTLTLRSGGMMNLALGYTPTLPGVPPLRGERLVQVTRVACL